MTERDRPQPRGEGEQTYFSTARAIYDLRAGKDPHLVFPRVSTPVTLRDLKTSYMVIDQGGKKAVVNTLRTAFAIDVAHHLATKPLRGRLPYSAYDKAFGYIPTMSKIVTPVVLYNDILPEAHTAFEDTNSGVKEVTNIVSRAPLYASIMETMRPLLDRKVNDQKQEAKTIVGNSLANSVQTLDIASPAYFFCLAEMYKKKIAQVAPEVPVDFPDLRTFLDLMDTSLGLLQHPAARDQRYLITYETKTGLTAVGSEYDFSEDDYILDRTSDGRLRIKLTRDVKTAVQEEYEAAQADTPSQTVTGCPANVQLGEEAESLIIAAKNRVRKYIERNVALAAA